MSRHFPESPQFLDMTSFSRIAEFVPFPVTSCFPDTKSQKRSYNSIENINFDESLECDVISNNSGNFRKRPIHRELRELNGEQG